MSAEDVGASYGLDEDACLQMGSDQLHSQEAFRAVTGACLREASSSGPPSYRSVPSRPTFTGLERMTSCGINEAQRYNYTSAPSAPVKGNKKNPGRLPRQNAILE